MNQDPAVAELERLIEARESGMEKLGIADRIAAGAEIHELKDRLEHLRGQKPEVEALVEAPMIEPPLEPLEALASAARRRGMSFAICFLPHWRRGVATECTFCRQPFAEDEIYLSGELFTVDARRWRWIALHEDCVLKHSTMLEYFTQATEEDFHGWFREEERLQRETGGSDGG
jgi:hypothetical protein